eukprot:271895-Amphidinium_carterae.1
MEIAACDGMMQDIAQFAYQAGAPPAMTLSRILELTSLIRLVRLFTAVCNSGWGGRCTSTW